MTEPALTSPRRRHLATSHWAVVLAGPIVGTTYFFVVYLLAEASCADGVTLLDTTTLRIVIVVAAVASIATLLGYVARVRQLGRADVDADSTLAADRQANRRFMLTTGSLLLGMFVLFVLFLAAPNLGGSLC